MDVLWAIKASWIVFGILILLTVLGPTIEGRLKRRSRNRRVGAGSIYKQSNRENALKPLLEQLIETGKYALPEKNNIFDDFSILISILTDIVQLSEIDARAYLNSWHFDEKVIEILLKERRKFENNPKNIAENLLDEESTDGGTVLLFKSQYSNRN